MTKTGIISAWREAEGHGFITPSDGSFDIVFHRRAVANGEPRAGLSVRYTLDTDKSGKPERRAVAIEVLS
jgi:cold shock CspA family protein